MFFVISLPSVCIKLQKITDDSDDECLQFGKLFTVHLHLSLWVVIEVTVHCTAPLGYGWEATEYIQTINLWYDIFKRH